VIHTQPSATATAGQAFAVQPVIYEEDQYGNLERGDNSTRVTVGLKAGTGPLHGTTTVTVAGGIAGFSALADDKAESIVLVFTSGTLAKATSTKITISSGSRKRMIKGVKATVKETSRAMSRHAIRGSRLPATTIPHARLAMTSHPRQPSVVPASEVSSLAACATANGVSAVVGAASLPVRVPAELKASVATYFVARLHADCDVN